MTLEMRGICKSFGSNDVLKHVDFSIQGGEICALLGENGAGKTTLMNILGGVLPGHLREHVYRPGTENQIRPVGRQNHDSKDPGGL